MGSQGLPRQEHDLSQKAPAEHTHLVSLTLTAFRVAAQAVANSADALGSNSVTAYQAVADCERRLDQLDRELDERITQAVIGGTADEARSLLACMKLMTDLERIGDLVATFAGRCQAVGSRLEMEDVRYLIQMASVLERMIADATKAFAVRDLQLAIHVLRADSEIDRLRNLICIRHVDGQVAQESVQVLFMAQALERAGDHAKNLAEEICHCITGHSVRHTLRSTKDSQEQMFVRWLKQRHSGAASNLNPGGETT